MATLPLFFKKFKISFVPDIPFGGGGYVRIRDDIQGIMTYGDPICKTGMWKLGQFGDPSWQKPSDYKYENVDLDSLNTAATFLSLFIIAIGIISQLAK